MEGLNLKGSPQAIDSVDAVQIDSMVSSLRSLLDPLPNSFLPRPSSRQLQFSSKLISLVPIFDSIRQPSYKSIGTTRSLQLLPRLLFNLEISNRGESVEAQRISSSSEISPEIEDLRQRSSSKFLTEIFLLSRIRPRFERPAD